MRELFFRIFRKFGGASLFRNLKGDVVTVLCLHRISDEQDFFFEPIRPHVFEQLITYCVKHYSIVRLSDVDIETEKPKLVLSFDDGYFDFMEFALPVLSEFGVPCNHNFVNSCINGDEVIWTHKLNRIFQHLMENGIETEVLVNKNGGLFKGDWMSYYLSFFTELLTREKEERTTIINDLLKKYSVDSSIRMMSQNEMIQCHNDYNVEIGSHTYNHESLYSVSDRNVLIEEIDTSIREIEESIGGSISVLSLPNGQHNPEVLEHIKELGIKFVLMVDGKVNSPSSLIGDFNVVSRINMVQEPIDEIIMRTLGFHSIFK